MDETRAESTENFGRLFVQHQGQIYGYIRALAIDRHDADEILQETAAVLWTKFNQFQPGTNFLAWSLAVAHREARAYLRRKQRQGLVLDESVAELLIEQAASRGAHAEDVKDALAACLLRLEEDERQLVRTRYQFAGNIRELAEQLSRPASTVYNALARIHRKLLACVEQRLASEGRP